MASPCTSCPAEPSSWIERATVVERFVAPRIALLTSCTATAPSPTLLLISLIRSVASSTFLAMSSVVTDCSSAAAAMEVMASFTLVMTPLMVVMASAVRRVTSWMMAILLWMSFVAVLVWEARSFTSLATTANPFPISPARADSMVAFRARSFVWSEISRLWRSPGRSAGPRQSARSRGRRLP